MNGPAVVSWPVDAGNGTMYVTWMAGEPNAPDRIISVACHNDTYGTVNRVYITCTQAAYLVETLTAARLGLVPALGESPLAALLARSA